MNRAGVDEGGRRSEPVWQPDEVWIDEGSVERDRPRRSRTAGAEGRRRVGSRAQPGGSERIGARLPTATEVPRPVVDELSDAAGKARGARLAARLAEATHAYDRERYQEARRILRRLAEEVPNSAAVQELYGLVLYRSGQWAAAAGHLERYRTLTGGLRPASGPGRLLPGAAPL